MSFAPILPATPPRTPYPVVTMRLVPTSAETSAAPLGSTSMRVAAVRSWAAGLGRRNMLEKPPACSPLLAALALAFLPASASAQCRMGSGPDHGDGIPYCDQVPSPAPTQPDPLPADPPSWNSFAAAVVWADSDKGEQYIGISKYFDEQAAVDRLITVTVYLTPKLAIHATWI